MSIQKFYYLVKFYLHNLKLFKSKKKDSTNIILIEYFEYFPSLISFSYFANILAKNHNAKIYCYNTRIIPSYKKIINFFNPKKIIFFIIYNSFNIEKLLYPKKISNFKDKTDLIFKNIFKNIKYNKDILKIKIFNVPVGECIYDEYLRLYLKPTINFNDKEFKKHLKDMINLFLFWDNYFKKKKIKSVIVSHTSYSMAIVCRLAIYYNIDVYNVANSYVYRLNKKNMLRLSGFKNYKDQFKKIQKNIKKDLVYYAKKELNDKILGKNNLFALNQNINQSSYNKTKIKKIKSKKEKILIATHCFTDAVHAYGDFMFADFYMWLDYLGQLSNKLNYEWLIKIHPSQFELNYKEISKFTAMYPKLELLNKNISHNEIINSYDVLGVITVYGSIGHEYPLFNIPVINCSIKNPHYQYSFNLNPQSKLKLKELIKDIKNIKKKFRVKKKEIYEYYYMRYMSEYYCVKQYNQIQLKLGKNLKSSLIYKDWLESFNLNHHNKLIIDYQTFIKSKKFRMIADNTSGESVYLDL